MLGNVNVAGGRKQTVRGRRSFLCSSSLGQGGQEVGPVVIKKSKGEMSRKKKKKGDGCGPPWERDVFVQYHWYNHPLDHFFCPRYNFSSELAAHTPLSDVR